MKLQCKQQMPHTSKLKQGRFMSEEESGLDSETNKPILLYTFLDEEGMLLLLNSIIMTFFLQI